MAIRISTVNDLIMCIRTHLKAVWVNVTLNSSKLGAHTVFFKIWFLKVKPDSCQPISVIKKTISLGKLIYGRNFENQTLFKLVSSKFSFSVLPTFWANKTAFDFEVFTVNEVIRPSFNEFRAVLSCKSPISPQNRRQRQNFCIPVSTGNSDPFVIVWPICERYRTLESLKSTDTYLFQLNTSLFVHSVPPTSLNWPKKVVR